MRRLRADRATGSASVPLRARLSLLARATVRARVSRTRFMEAHRAYPSGRGDPAMITYDTYSVDPSDDYLAAGGHPAAVRHDPTGHEDCARDWDPCACHGDRLCRLGKLMRWLPHRLADMSWTMAPTRYGLSMEAYLDSQSLRRDAAPIWPILLTEARAWRERMAARP